MNQSAELTPLQMEWERLVSETNGRNPLWPRAMSWLSEHSDDLAAGAAIEMLIQIEASEQLIELGKSWLKRFPTHYKSIPNFIGQLLKRDPSPDTIQMVADCLESVTNPDHVVPIIEEALKLRADLLLERISKLVDEYPESNAWLRSYNPDRENPDERVEKIIAKCIRLNVDNSRLYILQHTALATSPEIINACVNWMRSGGLKNAFMPDSIPWLIPAAANYHLAILPRLISFTKEWLSENHNHKLAGSIYAAMIYATQNPLDIKLAKKWYEQHPSNESAWLLISNLLEIAYWNRARPDPFAVAEARVLLRGGRLNYPRLIGSLVSVCADEETIAWAKESYRNGDETWILIRLLLIAPDDESIAMAETALIKLKDPSLQADLLSALLRADPQNLSAGRRAREWLIANVGHKRYHSIKALIQKS